MTTCPTCRTPTRHDTPKPPPTQTHHPSSQATMPPQVPTIPYTTNVSPRPTENGDNPTCPPQHQMVTANKNRHQGQKRSDRSRHSHRENRRHQQNVHRLWSSFHVCHRHHRPTDRKVLTLFPAMSFLYKVATVPIK
jgi:hypothetical protein